MAKKSLRWIRGDDYKLEPELKELEDLLSSDGVKVDKVAMLTKRTFILPTIILCILFFIHASVGADTLSYYSLTTFIFPGVSLPPSVIAVFFQLSFTVGMLATALLPQIGRRLQFILGTLSISLHMFLLGIDNYLAISATIPVLNYLPVFLLISFGVNFGLGIGAIPWTLTGEVFPQHLRTYGCAITVAARYVMQFIQLKLFFITTSYFGLHGVYWCQACVAVLGTVFAFFFLPETRNKTFTELENIFKGSQGADLENNVKK